MIAALAFALCNLYGIERHKRFVAGLRARGVATSVAAALGPELQDEENFFAHPAVKKIAEDGPRTKDSIGSSESRGSYGNDYAFSERAGVEDQLSVRDEPGEGGHFTDPGQDPELDGLAEALERTGVRPLSNAPERSFSNRLTDGILTLGARGIARVRDGDAAAAARDTRALLRGARTLLQADLPFDDKVMGSATVNAATAVIQEGLWLGRWDAEELARFDELLGAIDPQRGMISGLRCNLSFSAELAPRRLHERKVLEVWHSYDLTTATWPQRAQAVWYYKRPRGFWLGDLAERSECMDAWLRDRIRFTAADWKRLRPEWERLMDPYLIPREQGIPLGHVALAAGHVLDLETHIAMARIAVAMERVFLREGRFPENPFAEQPELARILLIDPWTGDKFQITPLNGGGQVEIRSLGPDGVADAAYASWNNFSAGDRVWKCGRLAEDE